MSHRLRLAILILTAFGPQAMGVVAATAADSFVSEKVLIDDRFETDSRADYRIIGDPEWSLLKLTLPPKSGLAIAKPLEADFELGFETRPRELAAEKRSITQVSVVLTNGWKLLINIVRVVQDGVEYRQAFLIESDGRKSATDPVITELGRTSAFRINGGFERWLIDYRFGVLRLSFKGRELATVYSNAFSSWPSVIALTQATGVADLTRFTLEAETTGYSEGERECYKRMSALRRQSLQAAGIGDLAKAIELEARAIDVHRDGFGAGDYAIGLMHGSIGELYATLQQPEPAIEHYENAVRILGGAFGSDHPEALTYLSLAAEQVAIRGDLDAGERAMRSAVEAYLRYGSPRRPNAKAILTRHVKVLTGLCNRDFVDRAYPTALRRCEDIAKIYSAVYGAESWQTDRVQSEIGLLRRVMVEGDSSPLEAYLRERAVQSELVAEANLDATATRQDRLLGLAREALAPNDAQLAEHLVDAAVRDFNAGLVDRSIRRLQEAIGVYGVSSRDDDPHPARARMLMGSQLSMVGRVQEAGALLKAACDFFDDSDDGRSAWHGKARLEMGRHLIRIGRPDLAGPQLVKALQVFHSLGLHAAPDALKTCERLADVHRAAKQIGKAEEVVDFQRRIVTEVYGEDSSQMLDVITADARHQYMRRKNDEAIATYERARSLAERHYGVSSRAYRVVLDGLIDVHLARRDLPAVVSNFEERLENELYQRESLYNIYSEREQLDRSLLDRGSLDALLILALEGHLEAERAYEHAVAFKGAVTARQRAVRLAERTPAARGLVERLGQIDGQTRSLLETPSEDYADTLAELDLERRRVLNELATINASSPRALRRTNVAELTSALPEGVALIDFYEYVKPRNLLSARFSRAPKIGLVAFVLTPSGDVHLIDLGGVDAVAEALQSWRTAMYAEPAYAVAKPGAHARKLTDEWGEAVRRLLWDPLRRHLREANTVVISPSVHLAACPFAALPAGDAFLIERFAVATLATPRLLPELLTSSSDERSGGLVLLGDVDYDRGVSGGRPLKLFTALKHAAAELREVERAYTADPGSGDLMRLAGAKATEGSLREHVSGARYLHLCTHGFCLDDRGLREEGKAKADGATVVRYVTGIALAGSNRVVGRARDPSTDGLLVAEEIAELDLSSAELVTLSACQTGLGAPTPGEGMLGAHRALHVAGAGSSLTALWAVEDEATAALMSSFYRALWVEGLPKGEALQRAMRFMLREYSGRGSDSEDSGAGTRTPPVLWAGFVLHGDWR